MSSKRVRPIEAGVTSVPVNSGEVLILGKFSGQTPAHPELHRWTLELDSYFSFVYLFTTMSDLLMLLE